MRLFCLVFENKLNLEINSTNTNEFKKNTHTLTRAVFHMENLNIYILFMTKKCFYLFEDDAISKAATLYIYQLNDTQLCLPSLLFESSRIKTKMIINFTQKIRIHIM